MKYFSSNYNIGNGQGFRITPDWSIQDIPKKRYWRQLPESVHNPNEVGFKLAKMTAELMWLTL